MKDSGSKTNAKDNTLKNNVNTLGKDENKTDKELSNSAPKNSKEDISAAKNNTKVLKNKGNDVKIKVAKHSKTKKLVQIKKDKYEISWNIEGVKNTKSKVVEKKEDTAPADKTTKDPNTKPEIQK